MKSLKKKQLIKDTRNKYRQQK